MFSNPEPSPKNAVAVTELIPEIFVAESPVILPFAIISPVNVEIPAISKFLVEISVPKVVSPTLSSPDMNTLFENVEIPANVDKPVTLT